MAAPGPAVPGDELRVRFAALPASVPGARRFVTDGLRSWGRDDLTDDAELCVSELAGNAALHSGSTFMQVSVRAVNGAVLVSVDDDGVVPSLAISPRSGFPEPGAGEVDDLLEEEPTTGRGLAIVSMLADDWGVEQNDDGTRVWALIGGGRPHPVNQPTRTHTAVDPPTAPRLPEGWTLVRLAGCPVRLSLRQDDHLDELTRELQLMSSAVAGTRPYEIVDRLQTILQAPAHARFTGRRQAELAALAGEEYVDIEMAMPQEFGERVRQLHAAVAEADELCRQAQLLTLASTAELKAIRAWMVHELEAQIERREPATPWRDWLSQRG